MSIDTSEGIDCDYFSSLDWYDHSTAKWLGKDVCQVMPQDNLSALTNAIQNSYTRLQQRPHKIKPLGEGSYDLEIEKDLEGTTTVSGSVSYESDKGVKVEAEVKVDTDGNTSGSVKVGGSFEWSVSRKGGSHFSYSLLQS